MRCRKGQGGQRLKVRGEGQERGEKHRESACVCRNEIKRTMMNRKGR